MVSQRLNLLTSALIGLIWLACRSEQIREHTYPQTFHYLDRTQLRGTMGLFANHIRQLNNLLQDETNQVPDRQAQIVGNLQAMELAANQLKPTGEISGHRLIDQNLDAFREELRKAREAAGTEPPHYFLAGKLVGACMACHRYSNAAR